MSHLDMMECFIYSWAGIEQDLELVKCMPACETETLDINCVMQRGWHMAWDDKEAVSYPSLPIFSSRLTSRGCHSLPRQLLQKRLGKASPS